MAKPPKNMVLDKKLFLDPKTTKELFIGKGTIQFLPPGGVEFKKFPLPTHWHHVGTKSYHIDFKHKKIFCPICEMLKHKTKWQRIKEFISKILRRK